MKIRAVKKSDLKEVCAMIFELAEYEKLRDKCKITVEDLDRALFTDKEGSPQGFVCEFQNQIVGYMITFFNFSTFHGRKGLYLEDLYIRPMFRRNGLGRKAFMFLADYAVKNNCIRLEWSVLDWNTPAIDFYKSLGAQAMSDWTTFRLSGDALSALEDTKGLFHKVPHE